MREAKDILLALGIPVAAFDRTLRLVVANGQAQRLLPAAVPGAQAKDVFSRKAVIAKLLSVLETGNAETLSVKPRTERDHDLFLTITRVISRSREKDLLILVTIEDRSPLREAKAMRSDFVANVSHEIRSPLTAISGFVETLQGGMVDDEEARSHFLGLMEKEATRMKNLVTDLLSLSQVEVKENRQIKKPADLNAILAAAAESVTPLAQERKKRVELTIDAPLPIIAGHTDNLLRVFINLLENAINYSREQSLVQISATERPPGKSFRNGSIVIAIEDQGDGIPPEEIPRLTERFYRVDKSRSRNVGGTGLGLAIVKHILVRHRARLTINSEPGVGSTFSVTLPIAPVKKSALS